MKPAAYISKIRPDPEGLDFKGFREEGIRLAQQLSGEVWSDYNLHDPGVTLLEVLGYALTDLVYRAGLEVKDYLASGSGEIDFNAQGLFLPDEILSCHPLTDNDYRKLILDAVSATDNVWIARHGDKPGEIPGLCRIYALLGERVKDQCNAAVRRDYAAKIAQVYAAHRNLCEDLAKVIFVERLPFSLRGEIETDGKREPASVLAEIHFECARYLSPKASFRSYREVHAQGHSLEALFTGVYTGNGYIADEELHDWRGQFSISELVGRISRIDGVKHIGQLLFVDAEGSPSEYIDLDGEHAYRAVACLQRFATDGTGITLHKAGKIYSVSAQDVELEYNRLDYASVALRTQKNTFEWVKAMLPAGAPQNISEYYSIQHHFPAAYGINSYGVPDSSPAKRKAQAMQLKAYLLMFEQVMANFLQNAHEIRRLFSLDEGLTQSYFFQVLRNSEVPKAEDIYLGDTGEMAYAMSTQLSDLDNFGDRRNRVLDYLLALHGEKFSQHSLRHFFAEGTDVEDALIKNKIAFLKSIVEISANRAAAFDYRKPQDGETNCTGLQKKLKMLLGLRQGEKGLEAYIQGDADRAGDSIQIIEHTLLRPVGKAVHEGIAVPEGFYGLRASIIFHSHADQPASAEFRKLAEQTVHMNCPAHIYPQVLWLDVEQMSVFSRMHMNWLQAKGAGGAYAAAINAAAERLIGFLLRVGEGKNG